jgi:xanthine dehydrogenase accessory factor
MKNIYLQIPDHLSDNNPLVLATVTRATGSTPQKPGSSALFGRSGLISGTVGGGIVENRVHKLALDSIMTGVSKHLNFNLANDITLTDEAICGGEIGILIDGSIGKSVPVLIEMKNSLEKRNRGVLITKVTSLGNNDVLIDRFWIDKENISSLPSDIKGSVEQTSMDMISAYSPYDYRSVRMGPSGKENEVSLYFQPVFPPDNLVIAGAGHIGKALAHLGSLLDFEVIVIDDRPEFANAVNIPDADHIIVKDIGEAMREMKKGDDTYIVIVTRGHKDDAAALKPCIGTDAAYLGMIGSKSKVATMRRSFLDNGWATDADWEKLHAPIGIDIKSKSVEEIAVSIAAEVVLERNNRKMK